MADRVKFINKDQTRFYAELKSRVENYFAENRISEHANGTMVFKTIVMLALYFVPYALILSGTANIWVMWLSTAVMGFGLAGIGMSVMHDANHGAYSSNSAMNRFIGYVLNLVGADCSNWKIQHNILHHTYTNIYGHDEDINNKVGARFSPHGKYKPFQRFQVVYVFALYALMTAYWVLLKDFLQYFGYAKRGIDGETKRSRVKKLLVILSWKAFYIFYMFVLPTLLLDIAFWQVLAGFMTLHVVGGLVLSVVFQLAHVVEGTSFPAPDANNNIENEWAIHQLQTTADFSRNSRLITFYVGGLNFQTEHHLFPKVCHVHYPKIAPIVKQTAEEFGIPYLYYPNIRTALASHVRMLKKLGRNEIHHLIHEMG